MHIEQLINHDDKLEFHEQHLCCYNCIQGAIIRNNICIVSPEIKELDCNLNGILKHGYSLKDKYVEEYFIYNEIVFTSNIILKLSQICNVNIKRVYFMDIVNDIEIDVDIENTKIPELYLNVTDTRMIKKLNENNIPFRYIRSSTSTQIF